MTEIKKIGSWVKRDPSAGVTIAALGVVIIIAIVFTFHFIGKLFTNIGQAFS